MFWSRLLASLLVSGITQSHWWIFTRFGQQKGYGSVDFFTTRMWTPEGSVFGAVSLCFLFLYEISREPLNGFAPNPQGRRVWSLAQTSLKIKVKDKRSRSPGTKTAFSALSAACVRLMLGKTSFTSGFFNVFVSSSTTTVLTNKDFKMSHWLSR